MKVKAAIALEKDKPLVIDYIELDGPKKGEVLVEIKSTGVCHSQLHHMKSPLEKMQRPLSLGHEGTGYVEKIGKKVKDLKEGDKVLLHGLGKILTQVPLKYQKLQLRLMVSNLLD